jgi:hypothetical protein
MSSIEDASSRYESPASGYDKRTRFAAKKFKKPKTHEDPWIVCKTPKGRPKVGRKTAVSVPGPVRVAHVRDWEQISGQQNVVRTRSFTCISLWRSVGDVGEVT